MEHPAQYITECIQHNQNPDNGVCTENLLNCYADFGKDSKTGAHFTKIYFDLTSYGLVAWHIQFYWT